MLEIEIKVKVSNIDEIKSHILNIGGQHSETVIEEDMYYNAPHRDFGVTDEALRVRSAGEKTILTYKGPKNTLMGSKVREECNVTLDNATTFGSILIHLVFKPVAKVRKLREYYTYQDFSIALDNVDGLGTYVEIELITENDANNAAKRVDQLAEKLGVGGERISISYLELLMSTH